MVTFVRTGNVRATLLCPFLIITPFFFPEPTTLNNVLFFFILLSPTPHRYVCISGQYASLVVPGFIFHIY